MARKVTEMATDTSEVTAEIESDVNPQDDKQTRERVDLDTLPDNEKVALTIQMPAALKRALVKAGESHSLSATAFAMQRLAELVEYQIPTEFLEHKRSTKYASEEEKKEAQRKTQLDNRIKMAAILKALQEGKIDQALLDEYASKVEVKTRTRKSKDAE